MTKDSISRREIIRLLTLASFLPSTQLTSSCKENVHDHPLKGIHRHNASDIANAYLTEYPHTNGLNEVKELLQKPEVTDSHRLAKLQEMIKTDFDEGKTVNLFGWILSQTEANLFVIAANLDI